MIALFSAIYILVGYLNDGTDLSSSERVNALPLAPTPSQSHEVGQVTVQSTPTPTRVIAASGPRLQSTPTMPVQTLAVTVTVEPSSTLYATATPEPTAKPSATATLEPTATASPTVTVEPTATSTAQPTTVYAAPPSPTPVQPAPTASAVADGTAQLVQRVIDAEEEVKSGRLEASFESEQGNDSTSSITFDFGDAANPPRMHFVSTYTSAEGSRTTELTATGESFWERIDQGTWVENGAREGVWGQVQGYLPGVAAVSSSTPIRVEGNRLTWSDPERGIDVTLLVDPATGVPQELRRASRSTDTVVIVTYKDWNAPVDIQIPPGT